MRYILNDSGYIETISFTHEIECNNKTCTEYTGTTPSGYESLAEWSENANINAYKIVEGNLTYDSEEDARLQNLWASQEISETEIILYENSNGANGTVTLNESSANFNYIEIFYGNSAKSGTNSVKVYQPNGKGVDMSLYATADNNNLYIVTCRSNISGTTITPSQYGTTQFVASSGTFNITTSNSIYIYRVVGYR